MKLRFVAAAVAALAASSAFAFGTNGNATTVYLTGASASRPDLVAALGTMCSGGGLLAITNSTDANNRLYKCTTGDFTGNTGVNAVALNVNGGSLNSVLKMGVATTFVDTACTATPCATTVSANGEGGFSDLDLKVSDGLIPAIGTFTPTPTGLGQTFGIAVSSNLYDALLSAQQAAGLIDAACLNTTTTAACTPSISKAEFSTVMNGTSAAVKTGGTSVFNGVAVNGLVYCRRPQTSGTQTGAQIYFLNSPTAAGSYGGNLTVAGNSADPVAPAKFTVATVGAKLQVSTGSGTGDAIKCLNQATNTGAAGTAIATGNSVYRVGVLSAENVPAGTDTWKFVRLSEVPLANPVGATSAPNTDTALKGRYDYFLETVSYNNGTTEVATLLSTAAANMTGSTNPGIFKLTTFKHNGGLPTAPVTK